MAQQLFANNAFSSLASTITNVATSITLATGHGSRFPTPSGGDHFLATLVGVDSNGNENSWEIVKVTTRSADVLTVVRGQEGSTALPWVAGSRIELRATSGTFAGLLQLAGGIVTGATTFSSGAYTALKVGVTGLVSVGGEAGSAEAKLTVTDAGNVGLEFSPTAIAGANRILSYNRASMAFAPMTLMALSHKFNVGGTDMVTVDSTGMSYTGTLTGGTGVINIGSGQVYKAADGKVGLGATAPVQTLHIQDATANNGTIQLGGATFFGTIKHDAGSTGANIYNVASASGGGHIFQRGGTTQFMTDNAGNFGLGVTPSAWATPFGSGVFEISGAYLAGSAANQVVRFGQNHYYNGSSYVYKANGPASAYLQDAGTHKWLTAPSGTAGNAITFTQAMALDASGLLKLTCSAVSDHWAASGSDGLVISGKTGGVVSTITTFLDDSSIRIGAGVSQKTGILITGQTSGDGSTIQFRTGGAHVGRFDSSGNLLVGTTSGSYHTLQKANVGGFAAIVNNTSTTNGFVLAMQSASAAGTGWNFIDAYSSSGATLQFRVSGNGNVVNTNNSYGAISDLKLKDNIVDVTPKLAKLLQVRIVNYTLKADPNKTKLMGVIAQELEQISPGLIEETPDYEEVTKTREVEVPAVEAVLDAEGNEVTPAVPASIKTEEYTERVATGTFTKSVKYSVFVPMLIKGMQEQQAQIEALQSQLDTQNTAMQLLTARLEALEAK